MQNQGSSQRLSATLKLNNPLLSPGQTIFESDTQRSKTNKDEAEYTRYNDIPYNDTVLFLDTVSQARSETVPYRKDQALYVRDLNGLYYHDSDDSVASDDGITVLVDSSGRRLKKVGKMAAAQADSVAIDVPGLVADFNALLAKLRTAGVMSV
jgi:hypothetical protein